MTRRARLLASLPALLVAPAVAEAQPQPPGLLPASVTGLSPTGDVRPVADSAPAAPAARLLTDLKNYPPETQSALFATRNAADALYRVNLPSGRFAFGAALEDDCAQASAALALAEAAAFTGDARLAARAGGAVLSLLTLTELDPANPAVRKPIAGLKGEPTRFAATLALAVMAQPTPAESQLADARRLGGYLLTRVKPTGEVQLSANNDPGSAATPGVVLEALLALGKGHPDSPCQVAAMTMVSFYAESVKSGVTMTGAAALLPGFVEFTARAKCDPKWVAATFALADLVARGQVVRGRGEWVGGFAAVPGAEPGAAASAVAVRGLSRAAWLTRQVPDLARFTHYRAATFAGLSFVAARRAEAVGMARAGVAFLQSGAEGALE